MAEADDWQLSLKQDRNKAQPAQILSLHSNTLHKYSPILGQPYTNTFQGIKDSSTILQPIFCQGIILIMWLFSLPKYSNHISLFCRKDKDMKLPAVNRSNIPYFSFQSFLSTNNVMIIWGSSIVAILFPSLYKKCVSSKIAINWYWNIKGSTASSSMAKSSIFEFLCSLKIKVKRKSFSPTLFL